MGLFGGGDSSSTVSPTSNDFGSSGNFGDTSQISINIASGAKVKDSSITVPDDGSISASLRLAEQAIQSAQATASPGTSFLEQESGVLIFGAIAALAIFLLLG